MSERKTLIIFDTNVLRATEQNEITYGAFEFGLSYTRIKSFVDENGLTDFVELAVPRFVVDELNKQKTNTYLSDIKKLSKIYSRLSDLPNVDQESMKLPNLSFDYEDHIENLASTYFAEKKIKIIELPSDDKLKDFFYRILDRALNSRAPFISSNDYSDAGFKDALIWESILSYNDIKDFKKIILITRASGFDKDCIGEFEEKVKKVLFIKPSEDLAINELTSIYGDFLENKPVFDFARDSYFRDYLKKHVLQMKFVITDQKYPITSFEILEPCESIEEVEEVTDNEPIAEERLVNTLIRVNFRKDEMECSILVKLRTIMDDKRNINPVDSNPEMVDS
jgi:hypothetical protein